MQTIISHWSNKSIGERKPGPYIVVLVAAFAIFLLFKNVFNISLPALGLLGGII